MKKILNIDRARLSRELVVAVKMSPMKAYVIARLVGMSPSLLSQYMTGAAMPSRGDGRIFRVADLVGVPRQRCFADADGNDAADDNDRPTGDLRTALSALFEAASEVAPDDAPAPRSVTNEVAG